jgi:ABC-2 type transport system ATP-binding protein
VGPALEITGLTKRFGSVAALDGVGLTVPEGSIYGFLGPNGAGKTTTLRVITGLARADSGRVSVFGQPPASAAARNATGFLPDVPGFYPWMRAEEFLRFSGGLFGLAEHVLSERVGLLLDLAGLAGVDARIGTYSRGMKQRLGIAQALINAPRLLLLDEPTSALDPLGRKDVLEMIASLAGRTTVFFSTHILADVERVCDRVAILDRGRVVAEAEIDELKRRYTAQVIELRVSGDANGLAAQLASAPWAGSAEEREPGSFTLSVLDIDQARLALPRLVADAGLGLEHLESGEVSLEEVFVDLVGGERS